LGVPERMIQRWFRAGWIDLSQPKTIHRLAGTIFENVDRVEVMSECIVSVLDSVCRAFVEEKYLI
jgi:hypothetical protein